MCITIEKNSKEKIAKKNIKVYKSLCEDGISYFQFYRYIPFQPSPHTELEIYTCGDGVIIGNRGYHSWKKFPLTHFLSGDKIAIFRIPAGCKYYEGVQHDGKEGFISEKIEYRGNLFNIFDMFKRLLS